MEQQSRRYKTAAHTILFLCESAQIELLDPIEPHVEWGRRRHVRCKRCGREYMAIIRHQGVTKCVCSSKCVRDPREQYEKAKVILTEAGRTLLTPLSEWAGFKQGSKELPYLMRCNTCGSEITSIIRRGRLSPCPKCERQVSTPSDTYERFIEQLRVNHLEPCFSRSDWWGLVRAEKSAARGYPVRCTQCGYEFHARIVPGRTSAGVNVCPVCHFDYRTLNGTYLHFLRLLQEQRLEPQFSFADWNGIHHRVNGVLTRIEYPVRCLLCGKEYTAKRATGGVTPCTCQRADHVFRSKRERAFEEWLRGLGIPVEACDRAVLPGGLELDLYLPKHGVAFEFNGMFFHSSSTLNPHPKPRNYHEYKTELAATAGVRLYHFWEDTPDDLVKSIIESKLGISPTRVYARTCTLSEVSADASAVFFSQCHVDGAARSASVSLGLYKDGALVCCLSLMRRRNQARGTHAWEIGRFANALHTTVVGGYSRLLKAAIAYLSGRGIHELVSYCNRDLSPVWSETFYARNGFTFVGNSGRIYWYWAQRPVEINGRVHFGRVPRQAVQKRLLLQHFPDALPTDTEATLCERLGIVPVYNSGNFKFAMHF